MPRPESLLDLLKERSSEDPEWEWEGGDGEVGDSGTLCRWKAAAATLATPELVPVEIL